LEEVMSSPKRNEEKRRERFARLFDDPAPNPPEWREVVAAAEMYSDDDTAALRRVVEAIFDTLTPEGKVDLLRRVRGF
jgi:hypothetical protein